MTNTIRDLRLINSALSQTGLPSNNDYKALVCIFLSGGNDSNNWIVPTDTATYDQYAAIRQNLMLPKSSLLPLYNVGQSGALYSDSDGHNYGFHPACPSLQQLFGEDKLAVVFNAGTLVRPTTRAQYLGSSSRLYQPPQLFSHSDQVTQWETSIPDAPPVTGWGGRVADLLNIANPNGSISMSVSVSGANTFEIGNLISQYQVSTTGAVTVQGPGNSRLQAMKNILALTDANLQRTAYADVVENAIAVGDLLNTAITPTALPTFWTNPFPTTGSLGPQLQMVARLIQARGNPGNAAPASGKFNMGRQIFFCSVGGYDTHTSQVSVNNTDQPTNPAGAHYRLLAEVNSAMFAFQKAMEQLGVGDKVTTFTASDFSRTFPTNSQGSDHGWGAHHLIMGGAAGTASGGTSVKGGVTYGKLPTFALNGPDDTGIGRWIPTMAVDQYSATLAKWFGVDTSKLADIFPNLSRFAGTPYGSNVGFMF